MSVTRKRPETVETDFEDDLNSLIYRDEFLVLTINDSIFNRYLEYWGSNRKLF